MDRIQIDAMTMRPTNLFIVDDHYMVIEGIRSLLANETDIHWLGHATNLVSCRAFLNSRQPDVILMDVNLPDGSGIDLCREVWQRYPAIRIIGLSTFNQQSYVQRMMANGACGYLLKNADRSELLAAIAAVMRGERYISADAGAPASNRSTGDIPVLTRRELEVLALIAGGFTNVQIAERLFLSVTTVETHRKNLLAKFDTKNTANLILRAAQMQLI